MASSSCLKCLARPSPKLTFKLLPIATTSYLSTTPTQNAKKSSKGVATSFQMKKKSTTERKGGKPPEPGERKAMRKRIVLSNTNALEVPLQDVDAAALHNVELVGKVVGIPGMVVDSLRAAEAFKPTQGWQFFRRPGLLIRGESVVVSNKMKNTEESKETLTLVFDGKRVSGKSLMLLHAMTTAFVRGWIVLNIPDGTSCLSSSTAIY
jgi:small subunit ribosomal protein S29